MDLLPPSGAIVTDFNEIEAGGQGVRADPTVACRQGLTPLDLAVQGHEGEFGIGCLLGQPDLYPLAAPVLDELDGRGGLDRFVGYRRAVLPDRVDVE